MRSDILGLLRKAGDSYISGEDIAQALGVSRTAVWKHINELKEDGYEIESLARKGYRLYSSPDLLLPEEISNGLDTEIIGKKIIHYDEIPSTNNAAKLLASQGDFQDGTLIVSEGQSTGRGRMDRVFFSPKYKGIWATVLLKPNFLPAEASKCTLMAAVSVAKAMESFGLKGGIKWPNDLLDIKTGRKLTGILTEMNAEMDHINYLVIGTGINVNIDEEEFPEEIREKATSMSVMAGHPIDRVKFFQAYLKALDECWRNVLEKGFGPVIQEWRKYNITLGQMVDVIGITTKERYTGKAADIDEDGCLLVDTPEGRRRVVAGDVSIRPHVK